MAGLGTLEKSHRSTLYMRRENMWEFQGLGDPQALGEGFFPEDMAV